MVATIPWCGMYVTILVWIDVHRTIKRAEMWALYMALVRLSGPACIYTDNFCVVQALRSGVDACVSHNHNDADWWCLIGKRSMLSSKLVGT